MRYGAGRSFICLQWGKKSSDELKERKKENNNQNFEINSIWPTIYNDDDQRISNLSDARTVVELSD